MTAFTWRDSYAKKLSDAISARPRNREMQSQTLPLAFASLNLQYDVHVSAMVLFDKYRGRRTACH